LARAILIRRFGDAASAVAPAQRAAAGFAVIGWPVYEALALEAAGEQRAAQRIRERIGYLRKIMPQSSSTDTSIESILTRREGEIAQLVADGSTNREIAANLSVSVSLVEKYLSSIYGKLAITSRSQLTAYIFAHDSQQRHTKG
jgi:DNA-binding NarL/FixJ family response regulator